MKRATRVAIVNDFEVVVAGVAALLEDERVKVVETAASLPVLTDVDVVLYDTFAQIQGRGVDLEDLVRDSGAKVVIYTWNMQRDLVDRALAAGACGYLSKALAGPETVEALLRVVEGEVVVLGDYDDSVDAPSDWPGKSIGLTLREAEVVALIAQGLSNKEIADLLYLSVNSVKTYIRTAYRKIGVATRAQAVLWGVRHGFEPDRKRTLDPTPQ